jgi:hypothetical protein
MRADVRWTYALFASELFDAPFPDAPESLDFDDPESEEPEPDPDPDPEPDEPESEEEDDDEDDSFDFSFEAPLEEERLSVL